LLTVGGVILDFHLATANAGIKIPLTFKVG